VNKIVVLFILLALVLMAIDRAPHLLHFQTNSVVVENNSGQVVRALSIHAGDYVVAFQNIGVGERPRLDFNPPCKDCHLFVEGVWADGTTIRADFGILSAKYKILAGEGPRLFVNEDGSINFRTTDVTGKPPLDA
jgi:hypothetical protein